MILSAESDHLDNSLLEVEQQAVPHTYTMWLS